MNLNIVTIVCTAATLATLFTSCANYNLNYAPEVENWNQPLPDQPLSHTVFLIGDAGNATKGEYPPALSLLGQQLKRAPENSSVVFLGDNLYPNGMAPKHEKEERAQDEFRLKAQLDILKDYQGEVFFIAGNHDWYKYGIDGLQRERKFIEEYLDRDDLWEPDCGCGDPKEVKLTDDLILILLDSEWWLADWEGEPEINQGCVAKSRDNFKLLFEEALKGNREKNVIIAFHHPIYSKGPHGGGFTVKDHLFPLTKLNKNLWLSLPVVGSIYPFFRASVGTPQDLANSEYKAFREFVLDVARKNGNYIFASGHEHSLQYTEAKGQYFIVSGAGSKRSAVRTGEGTQFAYGNYGFAQLLIYQDGSTWVQFWSVNERGQGKVVFRKKIKGPLPKADPQPARAAFTALPPGQDSVKTQIVEYIPHRKGLGRTLWGNHYREAYCSELNYPVLRLDTFQGGVKPVKMGGGYQTNSLRLEAPDGRQFTMRSLQKDPTRTVPYPLSRSEFLLRFVEDAFNAAHPMSALPIPALADAVGVYHTNPRIFYVPQQAALGVYNPDFGDALYLVEERPDDDYWENSPNLGYPEDIISTPDAIEKVLDHHDHRIDYPAVVKSRVFDLLIGDWDRHDDQWRWAKIDRGDITLYRPIPRDRDQAFSKYDGLMYKVAGQVSPPARPLRPYASDQKKSKWSNFGSRHFDATFLSGASWEVWEQAIRHIQTNLTDSVIDAAFKTAWRDTIYQLDGHEITTIMKERRENLPKLARSLYEFHAQRVDVLGTQKKDLFEVTRSDRGDTKVVIYDTNKKGDKEGRLFERVFPAEETREIILYGLEDDDIFSITGAAKKGATIRIIGGLGHDSVKDDSKISGWSSKTIVYDAVEEKIDLQIGKETKLKLSSDPKYNSYNRLSKDYDFDYTRFFPSLGFNPDDGLLVGLAPSFVHYGFKKSPFASRHTVSLQYAFSTSGIELKYRGELTEALGKGNLQLDAVWRTPLYTYNFYGLGNDTENEEDARGKDFNRVRQRYIAFEPKFVRAINRAASYGFGPSIKSYRIDRTGDRFIDMLGPELNQQLFSGVTFLGFNFYFDLESLDDATFPSNGLKLSTEAGWTVSLDNSDQHFPYVEGALSIYQRIEPTGRLVFATRIGGKHIFNNEFEFFQGATLGGVGPNSNFRGFRRERFTGRSAFFQNTDLRWKALSSNNEVLPFSGGVFAGFDHGRVWVEGENSDTWHYSYGGGFWISPLDLIDLKFAFFRGDGKQNRFSFGGNFFF